MRTVSRIILTTAIIHKTNNKKTRAKEKLRITSTTRVQQLQVLMY